MNEKELREQLARLYQEGSNLAGKSAATGLTDAEIQRVAALKLEVSELRSKLDTLEETRKSLAGFTEGHTQFSQAAGRAPLGTAGGSGAAAPPLEGRDAANRDAVEHRAISQRFLESEVMTEFRRRGSSGGTNPVEIRSFFHGATPPALQHHRDMSPVELRALVTSAGLPTNFIAPFRVPGVFVPDLPDFTVRSAFLNGQTNAAIIQFYRELGFTNNAAFVAEATATGGSSGLKPESALSWELASATVQTLAHWIPVTNQTLEDDPQMQGVIEGRLIDGLRLVEDDALLNGTGTGAEIQGLMNVTGTQNLNEAYFDANPVNDVGEDNEDLNRILRGRRMVRQTGRARSSFVIVNPADMERFLSMTDANRQYMAGGPFANSGIQTLWRMPAIESESIDEGRAIVGDGRMAAVWDRMAASIKIGTIDDQFVRNMQTILAEERLAFATYRPAAFAKIELTTLAP